MLRYFSLIMLFGFFVSCSPDDSQTQSEETLIEEIETKDESISDISGHLRSNHAIIITSGVRARSGPTVNDKIIRSFDFAEIVTLKDSTDTRFVITSNGPCDEYGYKWYKIEDDTGKESWVFGKFIYQVIGNNETHKPIHSVVQINGKEWLFGAAVEPSFGPSNEDGLTGCDIMYIPFFYQKGDSKITLIQYDPTIVRSNDLNRYMDIFEHSALLLTQASEGGNIELTDLYASNEENIDLKMEIKLYYQDGISDGVISLRKNNEGFQIINFSKTNNQ